MRNLRIIAKEERRIWRNFENIRTSEEVIEKFRKLMKIFRQIKWWRNTEKF